jgi:hypothetical protein
LKYPEVVKTGGMLEIVDVSLDGVALPELLAPEISYSALGCGCGLDGAASRSSGGFRFASTSLFHSSRNLASSSRSTLEGLAMLPT